MSNNILKLASKIEKKYLKFAAATNISQYFVNIEKYIKNIQPILFAYNEPTVREMFETFQRLFIFVQSRYGYEKDIVSLNNYISQMCDAFDKLRGHVTSGTSSVATLTQDKKLQDNIREISKLIVPIKKYYADIAKSKAVSSAPQVSSIKGDQQIFGKPLVETLGSYVLNLPTIANKLKESEDYDSLDAATNAFDNLSKIYNILDRKKQIARSYLYQNFTDSINQLQSSRNREVKSVGNSLSELLSAIKSNQDEDSNTLTQTTATSPVAPSNQNPTGAPIRPGSMAPSLSQIGNIRAGGTQ